MIANINYSLTCNRISHWPSWFEWSNGQRGWCSTMPHREIHTLQSFVNLRIFSISMWWNVRKRFPNHLYGFQCRCHESEKINYRNETRVNIQKNCSPEVISIHRISRQFQCSTNSHPNCSRWALSMHWPDGEWFLRQLFDSPRPYRVSWLHLVPIAISHPWSQQTTMMLCAPNCDIRFAIDSTHTQIICQSVIVVATVKIICTLTSIQPNTVNWNNICWNESKQQFQ